MILEIILTVVVGLLIYFTQAVARNDRATEKIQAAEKEIDALLAKHQTTLYEVRTGGEISPCEVEFTLLEKAVRGLPSRVMLAYLKDLKAGHISIDTILQACNKAQAKHDAWVKRKKTL